MTGFLRRVTTARPRAPYVIKHADRHAGLRGFCTVDAETSIFFEARPPVAWGPGVQKPFSHCRVASGADKESVVFGCGYCAADTGNRVLIALFGDEGTQRLSLDGGVREALSRSARKLQQALQHAGRPKKLVGAEDASTSSGVDSVEDWNPWLEEHFVRRGGGQVGQTINSGTRLPPSLAALCRACPDLSLTEISSAISAIDSALWALLARCSGKTLGRLLIETNTAGAPASLSPALGPTAKKLCQAYCTTSLPYYSLSARVPLSSQRQRLQEATEAKLRALIELGFRAVKVYIDRPFGNFSTSAELQLREEILAENLDPMEPFAWARAAVAERGADFLLMCDAMGFQHGWRGLAEMPEDAGAKKNSGRFLYELVGALEKSNYHWLEEPLPATASPTDYSNCRSRLLSSGSGLNLAGCEALLGFEEFVPWINERAVDIIQPDATIVGGISVMRRLQRLAAQKDIAMVPHGFSDALGFEVDCALAVSSPTVKAADKRAPLVELPEHVLKEMGAGLLANGIVLDAKGQVEIQI